MVVVSSRSKSLIWKGSTGEFDFPVSERHLEISHMHPQVNSWTSDIQCGLSKEVSYASILLQL
jgi:hypothetical protein